MTGDLTREQLDEIETRCNAATPGPWKFGAGPYLWDDGIVQAAKEVAFSSGVVMTNSGHGGTSLCEEDAQFIAHARTDLPNLLSLARRTLVAEARIRGLEGMLRFVLEDYDPDMRYEEVESIRRLLEKPKEEEAPS